MQILDLNEERDRTTEAPGRPGRRARILLNDGPLRVTLIVIDAGGEIAEHHAPGPITVQPLDGSMRFTANGQTRDIGPGRLLHLGAGVPHSVASAKGCAFLLTHVRPATDSPTPSSP